jgi:hypothetical protein
LAVNPPRRPGKDLTGPVGPARNQPGFSLKPVAGAAVARVQPGAAPVPVARPSLPQRVMERLKTAVHDADIDAQIDRMLRFITLGLIDRSAPRGSYINFLV